MLNYVGMNRNKLAKFHYVMKATPRALQSGYEYKLNYYRNVLEIYIEQFGDNFYIIVERHDDVPIYFFAIPYSDIKEIFDLKNIHPPCQCWKIHINSKNEMSCKTHKFNIEEFYGDIKLIDALISGKDKNELLNKIKNDIESNYTRTFGDGVPDSRIEGIYRTLMSTVPIRDVNLRYEAFREHGYNCAVCGFNFENKYGEWGKGFAEVHHLIPFNQNEKMGRSTNPKSDLVVLCSNCHSMIHRQKGITLTVAELKSKLRMISK